MPPAEPAPPVLVPRGCLRLLFVAALALLLASVAASAIPNLPGPGWSLVRTSFFPSLRHPTAAVLAGMAFAHLYVLVPVMLLCALFCARLGTERGQALATGTLPSLLCFGVSMFAAGFVYGVPPAWPMYARPSQNAPFAVMAATGHPSPGPVDAPALGLLLLACFAVVRADPPAPARAGVGWTLAAGTLGAACVCGETDALGSIGALGLYVWWSAGWRRAAVFALGAAVVGGAVAVRWPPPTEPMPYRRWHVVIVYAAAFLASASIGYALRNRMWGGVQPAVMVPTPPAADATLPVASIALPTAPARRVIGFLLFVALMGVPSALTRVVEDGGRPGVGDFIVLPLGVAAGLLVTTWLERRRYPAFFDLGMPALVILFFSALVLRNAYLFITG